MPTSHTIDALKAEREALLHQARALDQAIAILEGNAILVAPQDATLPRDDFEGLGVTDAARKFLKAFGEPIDTGRLTKELLARGWKTNSKKPVATVYATLDNSPSFTRVGGTGRKGRWQLNEEKKG